MSLISDTMARKPDTPSDNPLLAKIDEARLRMKGAPTRNKISQMAGLDRDTLRQLELRGPEASLSVPSINAFAGVLGLDPSELIAVAPHFPQLAEPRRLSRETSMIPVLGNAAGAAVGAMALGEPIDQVERPPALAHVRDAYAVFISGDSMKPLHSPGDLRFVHPHKPPRAGDSVIVQTRESGDAACGWIKIFERQNGEWLICRQLNPEGEYKFRAEMVVRMHRVLTTAELFNK